MPVGTLAGTTGEARLLEITGLTDSDGVLIAGVRIITPGGTIVSDGSPDYFITAAAESANLAGTPASVLGVIVLNVGVG